MKIRLTFNIWLSAPADTQRGNPVNVTVTGDKKDVERLVAAVRRFYEKENARMKKEHEGKGYNLEWMEQ